MRRVPPHTHRRWTNRDVAHEVDHGGRRWLWGMVLGVVVASTPLAMWQLQQNECLSLAYEAAELRAEQEQLSEEERRLRARREELSSLDAIEKWAAASGLVRPSPENVVVVRDAPNTPDEWLALKVSE